jgi:DnaA N-terminal domain
LSAKATGLIWEADLPRPDKYVLLALADHAKEDGSDVYPSLARVQWKTGYSETQVRDIMRSLIEPGILVLVKKGGNGSTDTNRYRIDFKALKLLPEFKEWAAGRKGAKTVPINKDAMGTETEPLKGAGLAPEGCGFDQNKGTETEPEPRTIRTKNNLEGGDAASAPPANLSLPIDLAPIVLEPLYPIKPKAKPQDPRFAEVCDAIRKSWPKGEGYKCDITPADAGSINRMLATNHDWKAEELAVCVVARFMSASINPTESVKAWIGAVTDYQSGPRDKYGCPLYEGRALNEWRNQARVILYGPQPEQLQLAQNAQSAEVAWEHARDFLKHRMSPANYDTWIKPLRAAQMRDGVLFLSSPRSDAKEIFSMFGDLLERAIDGRAVDVKLVQAVGA